MDSYKRNALFVGLAVTVIMGLWPPWTATIETTNTHIRHDAGYSFIGDPPPPPESLTDRFRREFVSVRVDVGRLLIQWAVVAAATGALALVVQEPETKGTRH